MSVENLVPAPRAASTGREPAVPDTPLGELRALIRAGAVGDGLRVRRLLERLTDALDLEAAGALLAGARARAQLHAGGGFTATRVALLGSSTLDSVPALLTAAAVRNGILPEIRLAGFNQWQLEVVSGAPGLADLRPRVVACLLDDSVVFAGIADPVDADQVAAGCAAFPAELSAWLSTCRSAVGGLVVLTTIPLTPLRRHSVISYSARARIETAWLRMNAEIAELAAAEPATVVLSGSDLADRAGATFASDR
ncbi:MAG TPA: hypothetical protein VFT95_05410, partial [Micromonosporaceae bacterium]|nr:hypothetical protein [Micromonosporaceae bacterium]